ncbi:Uncharacterised protein [Raoultella terrigena]|jgi:hypothetical protein|uniref:Uncharacterized protein n=1 Tax=Raoultella terrigena TaxID=577 RepID=A0A7Z8Z8T5_RAOTE|nr:Uncharacterised protein [Raoultella terrigena]
MRIKFRQYLFATFVLSCIAFTTSANDIPVGTYLYTQQGEELIDGQRASVTWNIAIKDDKNAVVTMSSLHALYTCDGKYTVSDKGTKLALTWSGKDNTDTECDTPSPQFLLKKLPSGKVLVHSELFLWDPIGWKNTRIIR